jgi:hypothetical protein
MPATPLEPSFFDQVLDALTGSVPAALGPMRASAHRGGLKVWFDEPPREHYESQVLRLDGDVVLEIGFHAEHASPAANDEVVARLTGSQRTWRTTLGKDPEIGDFFGRKGWRRISETWPLPSFDDADAAFEIADRLGEYIAAIEPCRRAQTPR